MTLKEYLKEMNEEKAFRAAIYISGQMKTAKKIEGYPTVFDLANSETEFDYMLVFGTKDKWGDLGVVDIECNSFAIDGQWGLVYPDENDTFYPFSDYGRTWIAIPMVEATAEEGWPAVAEARKLLKDR